MSQIQAGKIGKVIHGRGRRGIVVGIRKDTGKEIIGKGKPELGDIRLGSFWWRQVDVTAVPSF